MNPAKIAAVGRRRIERAREDRRREGRTREAAYRALCKEVLEMSARCMNLTLDLAKANKEIDRLCKQNDRLRARNIELEDRGL